jgi:endonuclease YncB( thermonuclease family)
MPICSTLADYSGSVVFVLDGDTIEVLRNRHPERIRLSGIDCPEKGQALTCLTQDSNCTLRKSLNFEAAFLKAGMLQIDKELQKDGMIDLVD